MKELELDDPIAALQQMDPKQGKIELSPDGWQMYIPSQEIQDQLGDEFHQKIVDAEKDWEPVFAEIADNIEAYRGQNKALGDADTPVITLPIVGREVDQIVAWEVIQLLRPRPLVSFDPYQSATYEVPVPTQVPNPMAQMAQMMGGMSGGPMGMQGMGGPEMGMPPMGLDPSMIPETIESSVLLEKSAEDIANAYELSMDQKLRERHNIRDLLRKISYDLKVGGFSVLKTVYDRNDRYAYLPRVRRSNGFAEVRNGEFVKKRVQDGEACKIFVVPQFNVLRPIDCADVQEADWFAEACPVAATEMRVRVSQPDRYPLVKPDQIEKLLKSTTDTWRNSAESRLLSGEKKEASKPSRKHDVREVWFSFPVRLVEEDEMGKKRTRYEVLSLCGDYHMGMRRFLVIYVNPYAHQRRPYEIVTDPGGALVSKVKKHQALISQMLSLDITNAVHMNNLNIFVDPDAEAWDFLRDSKRRTGIMIPRRGKDEVSFEQAAQQHPGLGSQIGFVREDLSQTTNVSIYEQGQFIPARTPAESIRQIMNAGYQKPLMTLGAISDAFSRIIRMYLENKRQFEPYGEVVEIADPETKALLQIPMRHPIEPVFDNFRIALTASDEELAGEDFEKYVMLNQIVTQNNASFAQLIGPMASAQASPAVTEVMHGFLDAQKETLKLAIETMRRDSKRFLPSDEAINALLKEKEMVQQQMMGGMGGPNGPQAGALQQGGGGGIDPGMGEMAPAPSDAGVSAPPF